MEEGGGVVYVEVICGGQIRWERVLVLSWSYYPHFVYERLFKSSAPIKVHQLIEEVSSDFRRYGVCLLPLLWVLRALTESMW